MKTLVLMFASLLAGAGITAAVARRMESSKVAVRYAAGDEKSAAWACIPQDDGLLCISLNDFVRVLRARESGSLGTQEL